MENVEVPALVGADEKTELFAGAEDVVHGDLLGGHWRDKHEAHFTNLMLPGLERLDNVMGYRDYKPHFCMIAVHTHSWVAWPKVNCSSRQ